MMSVTTVNVGGTEYEISGMMWGTLPAWKLVKVAGQPMTAEGFATLSDAHKAELASHVRDYIANANRQRSAS